MCVLQLTGASRGCGFVTYTTKAEAESAMAALHDKHTLPGMQHAMQVKIADSSKGQTPQDTNRKLFGMLCGNPRVLYCECPRCFCGLHCGL